MQNSSNIKPPSKPSWRNLIALGVIKRSDSGMWAKLSAIRVREGFNVRDKEAADFRVGIESLKTFTRGGGKVPAMEVVLSLDGEGVDLIEGHRRTISYRELVAEGMQIEWVRIEPFEGNDLEQHKRLITSQDNEKLKPLEAAFWYKRTKALFGLNNEELALHSNKTRQHVEKMLILANAPHAVQLMVKARDVSATTAIDSIRENGDGAAEILGAAKQKATATGKKKVTASNLRPWTPPARALLPMVSAVGAVVDAIPKETRQALAEQPSDDETITLPALVLYQLLAQHGAIDALRAKADKKSAPKVDAVSMEAA